MVRADYSFNFRLTYFAVGISKIAKFTKSFENHKNKKAKLQHPVFPRGLPPQ